MSNWKHITVITLGWLALCAATAEAAPKEKKSAKSAPEKAATPAAEETILPQTGAEQVDVNAIKEKYWARGEETELGVVQNRLYSKSRKVEFSLLAGMTQGDPFLRLNQFAGALAFHFNEYFAVQALGWKYSVGPSGSLNVLRAPSANGTPGKEVNINQPSYFMGAEAVGNLLYGKLSVLGQKIIYYDLHLNGGAGATGTDSGTYFTPFVGVGQQVYLSQRVSFKLDYRLQTYNENLIEKVITSRLGEVTSQRRVWNNCLFIGIGILIGGDAK